MSAKESWLYTDPEKVAIRKEAKAKRQEFECGLCIHRAVEWKEGRVVAFCEISGRVYGKACDAFIEKRG